ncbi:polysaccharide lyase family 4 protein [Schizophyllum fasciatum]
MVVLSLVSLALAIALPVVQASFGVTENGSSFVVDTNAGLVFTVDSSSGDLTSIVYNGVETQGSGKHSHIASGIGASCTWSRGGHENNYITIPCTASGIIHYYVAKYNDPSIHMATYTSSEPSVGELRFIARLSKSALPNGAAAANIAGGSAIEGSDVFLVNGQTHSKFYSSRQFIDDQVHGVTGSGIGAYMVVPGTGFEGSSGGPFFRDIDNQGGDQQELYFYMVRPNSGHTQTESYRMGLHGPYAITYTTGSAPSGDIDTAFYDDLNIQGWVPKGQRGRLTGKASGFNSDWSSYIVVGWSNNDAQYWVRTSSDGSYTSPYMKPGTYTMTLYEFELAIASQSVTVSAGNVGSSNIASTIDRPDVIWQIGDYDGTPRGFLNADKIETMHPSDSRMSNWVSPFTVGQDVSSFPMAIFKDIGAATVDFTLSSSQGGARTLEIATTLAFAGGRPQVTINDWTSNGPSAPSQPDSRGVTRGTWRGNNILYSYSVPDGVLRTDGATNTLTINVISGSSGSQYLSPNFVVDTVRLY